MKLFSTVAALPFIAATPALRPNAATAQTPCQKMLFYEGVAFRGSAVCNPAWLDRPGALTILATSRKTCGKLPSANVESGMKEGFIAFDNMARDRGKAAACRELDKMLNQLGG